MPQPAQSPAQAMDEDAINFATLVRMALDHKRLILLVALAFTALAGAYVHLATPLYTATASLVLKAEQQNVLDLESVVPELSSEAQAMNTELLILESSTLLGQVVDSMSLVQDPEFNPELLPEPAWKEQLGLNYVSEALGSFWAPSPEPTPEDIRRTAIDILREKIEVTIVPETYAIEIAVQAGSPEKSAGIANKIADLYIAKQLDTKFTAMDDAMVWLGERVAELKGELEIAEEEVREYAAKATVITEEGLLLETEKLKRLRDDLEGKRETAQEFRARIDRLEALDVGADYAALAEFTDDPRLRSLARDMAASDGDGALRSRFQTALERRIRELRQEIDRTNRRVLSLEQGVRELESELQVRSSDFVRLQQLERESEATRLIYEHSLARMKELSIQQGIQRADARVLDPAEVPDEPSHPRSVLMLGAGGFFGALFGLLFVFLKNSLRTTLQSTEELETATGLPVIGIVPDARARRPDALLRQIIEKPTSPVAEAIRNLRTTIHLSNLDAPPQVVMLTSSVPGEGKSTVSAALAQASAMSGKRVLLIDADLRRRALRGYFHAENKAGLLSVLTGAVSFEDAVWHDDSSQLDILFSEEGKVTAGDVFGSHRFESFLTEVRRIYDLVVIDTAPILAVSDTRVISQHADAIFYVVRWNSTEQKMLRAGLNTLRQVNADVSGAIFNRVKATGSKSYGYYGYTYT